MAQYYDIDDILADEELVPAVFLEAINGVGLFESNDTNKELKDLQKDPPTSCSADGRVPGVTEAPFLATHSESKDKTNLTPPLNSPQQNPLQQDFKSDEWDDQEEVDDENHDLVSLDHIMEINGLRSNDDDDKDEPDPTCFMCDKKHTTIEKCMIHMHKHHGFFIPDVEYLKDPIDLFTHLGLTVKRDYTCLYCKHICRPFESLEAVRNHMVAKSHCKVHYGDAWDKEEEGELDELYDYSSSYIDGNGKQLIIADGTRDRIELGTGGSELIITTRQTDDKMSTKIIVSREYLLYYRRKPRPSPNRIAITAVLAANVG